MVFPVHTEDNRCHRDVDESVPKSKLVCHLALREPQSLLVASPSGPLMHPEPFQIQPCRVRDDVQCCRPSAVVHNCPCTTPSRQQADRQLSIHLAMKEGHYKFGIDRHGRLAGTIGSSVGLPSIVTLSKMQPKI